MTRLKRLAVHKTLFLEQNLTVKDQQTLREANLDSMKNQDQKKISIESPCIRNCCLNYDDICVGCFRHIDEIVSWANYNEKEKLQVLGLCQQREILTVK